MFLLLQYTIQKFITLFKILPELILESENNLKKTFASMKSPTRLNLIFGIAQSEIRGIISKNIEITFHDSMLAFSVFFVSSQMEGQLGKVHIINAAT